MTYHAQVRREGESDWWYLAEDGYESRLRRHAASFADPESAKEFGRSFVQKFRPYAYESRVVKPPEPNPGSPS